MIYIEQVPESCSPVEPEHAGVVSSSSTLHFATEAEEYIAEESVVLLEEKQARRGNRFHGTFGSLQGCRSQPHSSSRA